MNFILKRIPRCVTSGKNSLNFRSVSTDHPVSRFPIVDNDNSGNSIPADIKEKLEEVEEKSGFLPNVFKTLAYRPEEFRSFFKYYDALMEETDRLSKAEKEMIVVATSSINNCNYCLASHGALLRIFSKNPLLGDQVAVNYKHADITERQKSMLEFAVLIAKGQPIEDDDIADMQKKGFLNDEIWDIGAIASFFALSNRMAHLTNMRPNDEFYLLGRVPRDRK